MKPYKLRYNFYDLELDIKTKIYITVLKDEFIVECDNDLVKEQIINFLEWLDIELQTLDNSRLKDIIKSEFRIR